MILFRIQPSEFLIPAYQSITVTVTITPTRIDPDYEATITLSNRCNIDNDWTLQATSVNMDEGSVLQPLFSVHCRRLNESNYDEDTFGIQDAIFFGDVVLNNPTVRSFSIQSHAIKPITLNLHCTEPEITIFKINRNIVAAQPSEIRQNKHERLVESVKSHFSKSKQGYELK